MNLFRKILPVFLGLKRFKISKKFIKISANQETEKLCYFYFAVSIQINVPAHEKKFCNRKNDKSNFLRQHFLVNKVEYLTPCLLFSHCFGKLTA